jgi:hypothetical protein
MGLATSVVCGRGDTRCDGGFEDGEVGCWTGLLGGITEEGRHGV